MAWLEVLVRRVLSFQESVVKNGSDAWKQLGGKVTSQIVALDPGLHQQRRVL